MEGLTETIRERPYLASRISRGNNDGSKAGRVKLVYDYENENPNPPIWINDLTEEQNSWSMSYQEFRKQGAPISHLKAEILGPPVGYQELACLPIAAQVNFIQGGCLLNICINHSFCDGLGGAAIVGAWAQKCKELQETTGANNNCYNNPQIERINLGNTSPFQSLHVPDIFQDTSQGDEEANAVLHDPLLWQLLGLQKTRGGSNTISSNPEPTRENIISAVFVASGADISNLKAASNPTLNQTQREKDESFPHYITSFDATSALLWSSIMRARSEDLINSWNCHTIPISRLRVPFNLRQSLGIPKNYLGNALLNSVTDMPLQFLIEQTDCRQIASEIRSSINRSRDKQLTLDAIKLASILPEPLTSRRPIFPNTTAECLVLTSWQDLDYYKYDWGHMFGETGTPDFFRIPHGYLPGICALNPRKNDNSVEVLISMEMRHMEKLIKDPTFTKYFELVSM